MERKINKILFWSRVIGVTTLIQWAFLVLIYGSAGVLLLLNRIGY